ncbi:MAG TPA: TonB-dependent receptor, partial [Pyrinomonadaceae bacterium]|nr:TonB-dependent receptor [Pyrinomonadaceae bacterium]
GQIFRHTDNRAYAGNVIPQSDFDPRAVALLGAYPLPNTGARGFTFSPANFRNTRQETIRVDHNFNDNYRLLGRYTHDLNETEESSGLFNNIVLPNVSTTVTRTPGQTFVLSLTSVLSPNVVNEATYNFSSNFIGSRLTGRGRRSDYPGASSIGEAFPENNENVIPRIDISGLSSIGGIQGFRIAYKNNVIRDTVTWTRGNHLIKFGGEISFESKNENANANSQGTFGFTGNQTRGAFAASTLVGNSLADFLLGRGNTYSEAQIDPTVHLRFGRREFFVQDTWKFRRNLTFDLGVRYQYFQPVKDDNNLLATFDPRAYNPALAPVCANAACSLFVRDPVRELNGIIIAGVNSPFGEYIARPDKNNFSPRVGLAWDPFSKGKTIVRMGYGFYYDQPLVGGFENSAFFTPPFNRVETFTSSASGVVTLANPTTGLTPTTFGARSLVQNTDPNLITPEVQQWSLGVQHELFRNALIDLSYVGTKGDHLIRPINLNIPQPADVVRVGSGAINSVRPFRGFSNISSSGWLESSGKSRYHGLLSSFAYRFATGASLTLSYTFSKNLTNATNDRDAVDIPQNPLAKDAEYAEARTSRPHIFSASYVYELPFFKKSKNGFLRTALGGWQISGITNLESGRPIPRVVLNATGQASGQRGLYPNLASDPNGGLAGTVDPITGLPFAFDPNAFVLQPLGSFGNAPRAFAREPARNQTNLSAVKNIYLNADRDVYIQLRAESFNVFNHTQFLGINVTHGNAGFGQVTGSTRLPREFQFAAKIYF